MPVFSEVREGILGGMEDRSEQSIKMNGVVQACDLSPWKAKTGGWQLCG